MYCSVCFHRANWHSSTTLTEDFPCFFLSCNDNDRVKLTKPGHGLHSSEIVLFYVKFVCKCVLCYYHRVSTQLQLTNISTYQHTPLNSNQTTPVFLSTLSFNGCPKTALIRRSMKWISTRKPKSKHRKTCPELFRQKIYRLYYVERNSNSIL
jgi:hypothetical protein